jgi:hypothetical protein
MKAGEGVGASTIADRKARYFKTSKLRNAILAGVFLVRFAFAAADTNDVAQGKPDAGYPLLNYFSDWFVRVDQTRAEQPHWSPPVATVSPNLQEVLRYDIMQESLAGGRTLANFGSGKGLEFIPSEHIQFIVGIPPWQTENTSPKKNGWGDESFLVKYRFLSANEENGNYVFTGFLGLTVPNGSANYTTHHFVFTPTLAGGKGWGDFNIQGTAGVSVPDNRAGRNTLGTPVALNVTAQYRVAKILCPEVEANYTYWPNGTHEGLNQLFITPGLVVGKMRLWDRVGIMVGVGCQIAVTDHPLYHRNLLLTARMPF